MKTLALIFLAGAAIAGAQGPSKEELIAGAVLAAPSEYRDGATVIGVGPAKEDVVLRQGKGDFVCLANDPSKKGFNVACYHKDLEPFMARGRELVRQGVMGAKRNETRFKEVESGKVKMTREPRTLYVLTGSSFDAATGQVQDSYLRWVIYTPFATPESTGLSTKASESAPWLMSPGTAGAHIMISPPKQKR